MCVEPACSDRLRRALVPGVSSHPFYRRVARAGKWPQQVEAAKVTVWGEVFTGGCALTRAINHAETTVCPEVDALHGAFQRAPKTYSVKGRCHWHLIRRFWQLHLHPILVSIASMLITLTLSQPQYSGYVHGRWALEHRPRATPLFCVGLSQAIVVTVLP